MQMAQDMINSSYAGNGVAQYTAKAFNTCYECMRPSATRVCGLKLLVYAALSY